MSFAESFINSREVTGRLSLGFEAANNRFSSNNRVTPSTVGGTFLSNIWFWRSSQWNETVKVMELNR